MWELDLLATPVGHQEEKEQTQTHQGRPWNVTKQPRLLLSCRLGTAHAFVICIGINMSMPNVSGETWNSSKESLSVLCMTSPTNKQIKFPHSKDESCLRQGGQEGSDPSVVPLPCSCPHLCCSFPWQQSPNGAAGEDSSCLAVQGNHGNNAGQLIRF